MKAYISIAALALGCTTLSTQGDAVRWADHRSGVAACKSLGTVKATPPYAMPDDWKDELRNEAAKLGADTVYAESPGVGEAHGEAFVCTDRRPRYSQASGPPSHR